MDKNDDLKYQLETLASYESSDLDWPEFDVGYEFDGGLESFSTVCCVDLAERTILRINELEEENKKLKSMIENGVGFEDMQQDSMQSHIN